MESYGNVAALRTWVDGAAPWRLCNNKGGPGEEAMVGLGFWLEVEETLIFYAEVT